MIDSTHMVVQEPQRNPQTFPICVAAFNICPMSHGQYKTRGNNPGLVICSVMALGRA